MAHLSDAERMFAVTRVLSEVVRWMRTQRGSQSLRALVYMDEVFGYLPPTANPPSKTPMLTLLKQARAYGVGVVLATQNPVDLDYKALSNAGTWFLGRLQTERDKARVLDGLEGASASAGAAFDRAAVERTLSGLRSRVFLMHDVHEDAPVLFHTRWALSYLAGPLTREQIRSLQPGGAEPAARARPATPTAEPAAEALERPVLPASVEERFVAVTHAPGPDETLRYRPALFAEATLHYANARAGVDVWRQEAVMTPLEDGRRGSPWAQARSLAGGPPELEPTPEPEAGFDPLPSAALRATTYARWGKQLASWLYRERPLALWQSRRPTLVSEPDESEGAFRGRLRETLRDERDLALEKLRQRYAPKLARLQDQIARAEQRVEKEQEDYREKKLQSAVSIGATLVGALFGRKLASAGTVGRATTAARGVSRAARERGDIARAAEKVESLGQRLEALEAEFADEVAALEAPIAAEKLEIDARKVSLRKTDLELQGPVLLWIPWRVTAAGRARPAAELAPAEPGA